MSQATHSSEPFANALARRVLTQEMPVRVLANGDARREVAALAPHVAPLASGFSVTQDEAREALRGQQVHLADDVRSLFPDDSFMEHVSAQIEAKADGQAVTPQRPRER